MKPTLKALAQATATYCDIPYEELVGRSRKRTASDPRHTFWYVARHGVGHTLSHIGRWSDRDHTAVLYGANKMIGRVSSSTTRRIIEEATELDQLMRQRVRDEVNRTWGTNYDPKR